MAITADADDKHTPVKNWINKTSQILLTSRLKAPTDGIIDCILMSMLQQTDNITIKARIKAPIPTIKP